MYDIFDMQSGDYDVVRDKTAFAADKITSERADQHFAVMDSEQLLARCSVWWRDTAKVDGASTGAIGHYAATDEKAGRAVLDYACRELKNRGCDLAVGPLDGNTWRRYRLITERGDAKPFFLEPDNPDDWPDHFRTSGFCTLANYVSEINPQMAVRQPELGTLRQKFAKLGVTIEPVSETDSAGDMDGIYDVICESFRDAFLYTKLDQESFRQMYAPLLQQVDPRLLLLARHAGRVVGFVFAPPDYLQQAYHGRIDTIVIKTIAILPHQRYRGLGRLLIVDMLKNAVDMRYTTAVSALMQTDNRSQAISSACAGPMRRYELFARSLQS
jgi:L-amino acid N-acyltransferase YncA